MPQKTKRAIVISFRVTRAQEFALNEHRKATGLPTSFLIHRALQQQGLFNPPVEKKS